MTYLCIGSRNVEHLWNGLRLSWPNQIWCDFYPKFTRPGQGKLAAPRNLIRETSMFHSQLGCLLCYTTLDATWWKLMKQWWNHGDLKPAPPRIEFVRRFIKENSIKSVVDLGCGDWQFSPYIYHDLSVAYVGYDVVLPVIQQTPSWFMWFFVGEGGDAFYRHHSIMNGGASDGTWASPQMAD